jgi:hypothetical protein
LRGEARKTRRNTVLIGLGFIGAGAAAALTIGPIPAIACAGGAGIAFIQAYGAGYNDRFYGEAGEMIDRWTRVATAPPVPPPQTLPMVSAGPATKQELLDLMQASRSYLTAHLDQPGHGAALAEVEGDLAGLSARSETGLAEIQSRIAGDAASRRANMHKIAYGALAGMVGGFVSLPLVGVAGMVLGLGTACALTTAGHLMLQTERSELTLARHLQSWEIQLQHLKDMSDEVERLTAPGQSAGIQKQAGFLLVGGVRVPVAAKERTG